jgi:hypothetical protein
LLNLTRYLETASRPFLSRVHGRVRQGNGLVRNSEVLAELQAWVSDLPEIERRLEEFSPLQLRLLLAIYGAGGRGAQRDELLLSLPETERFLLEEALAEFRWGLLIARTTALPPCFLGFAELFPAVLQRSSITEPVATGGRISYQGFFAHHALRLMSSIQCDPWRCTRAGQPGRRHQLPFEEKLDFHRRLNAEGPAEECRLLLELLGALEWVELRGDLFQLTPAGSAALESGDLPVIAWALQETLLRRRHLSQEWMDQVTEWLHEERDLASVAELCWIHEGPRRGELAPGAPLDWAEIPRLLREFWLLGWVEFGLVDGRPATCIRCVIHPAAQELKPYATPDFQVLAPIQAGGPCLHALYATAHLETDDQILKFRLDRPGVLAALQGGVFPAQLQALLDWIGAPSGVRQALSEWAESFSGSCFLQPLALEISDPALRGRLAAFPPFAQLVERSVEGFGFFLHSHGGAEAAAILEQFGQYPTRPELPPIPATPPKIPLHEWAPAEPWPCLEAFPDFQPDKGSASGPSPIRLGDVSPSSKSFRDMDVREREKVINYCILRERPVEILLRHGGERRTQIQPLALSGVPADTLRARPLPSGEEFDLRLSEIVNLRVV